MAPTENAVPATETCATCHEPTCDGAPYCRAAKRRAAEAAPDEPDYAAEAYAEGAWLRAAEAGNPDTWAEEDRERQIAIYGYGPPPGY